MTLIDSEGKNTELQPGDRLVFHAHSKTISFHRGLKLFLKKKGNEDDLGKFQDKMTLEFISTKDDFYSFATFIGKILLLEGAPIKNAGENFIWEFTHKGVGEKANLNSGSIIRIDPELTAIMFETPGSRYRPIKNVTFIKSLDDYEQLFFLLSKMIDNCGTIVTKRGSRKIIFE